MTKSADANQQPQRARLDSLIEQAQSLMAQLVTLSKDQSQVIESGDVAQIIEIVSLREPVVQGLVSVGEEIGAFIENKQAMESLQSKDRDEAFSRIASIEETMKLVRDRDAQDQRAMEKARDSMSGQLAVMGTNRSALKAYSSRSGTPGPILQDREG